MRLFPRGTVLAGAVLACLAGCGVPQDGAPSVVDPAQVPYDLLEGAPAPAPAPLGASEAVAPRLFFLDGAGRPVGLPQELDAVGETAVVADLLARLAAGPTEDGLAAGLSSALGPGIRLELVDVADRVARVAVTPSELPPSADRLPLAIAQVVFTVTSAEGVDRVQLVRRGKPLEVPLPGGARTSGPLGADDYLSLITEPGAAPVATPVPAP